ncbi:DUF2169 family type VI secretion system accessory protein [Pseudovibrio sp. Alg231-02]|uniref:DUF2169 family type VI secretion system accessory protein n=1 Tax=Pseudovibrio sp. Alg231-02 TaxID=1922223 RepID=UPI000D55F5CF|nr:DUF2169 domain-containing protein [Pseudovibrio sp. Alg231-02]
MLDKNTTGFAALGFEQIHRDGTPMGVVAVRGRFEIEEGGRLAVSSTQELVLEDVYEADPHKTPMLACSDLVPFKPNSDVTALVNTYPPGDGKADRWHCGVKTGAHEYILEVQGPSNWSFQKESWKYSQPRPIGFAHLDYRLAVSDQIAEGPVNEDVPQNPLGMPALKEEYLHKDKEYPIPLIRSLNSQTKLDDHFSLNGFGPIPSFWRCRQQYAGTYDKAWKENRHPQLPEDFDYRFYQCANPKLIQNGYLQGNERIELAGVQPDGSNLAFNLPMLLFIAQYHWIDGREAMLRLNLDGVHINTSTSPGTVDLTWRGWLPICPAFFKIDLSLSGFDDEEARAVPSSGLFGFSEEETA